MQETTPASNPSRGKICELKMPSLAEIVVIKRNGTDGTHFPLTSNSCVFGRKKECDIRIQLPQVSKEHCKIEINENKEAVLFNLSSANPTQLNGTLFQDPTHLKHGDILTIIDRSFRFEYPRSSLPQKRLSRSQEKETLQILHVQHMQQMDLLHPQNSDYKSSPITGKKFEICSPKRNEKRLQKQYSTPEFNCKTPSVEKANELSPFSKLYELMKHKEGTGNVKEKTGDETLLEDVFHSRSRRSAMRRAKSTKGEQSEDSKIQGNHDLVASPMPTFEEKNSEKSPSTQNCDTQQKQECEGTNQSDVKNVEDNEVGKHAHFKANQQSSQHFSETSIQSLDDAEKAKCLNKFNVIDVFTSVENALPKTKPSWESTQNYSSPHSRRSRRSSKSKRTGVEVESLNRRKSSGEMKECPLQVSEQEHESGILIENIYSKTNENRELVAETAPNLKDSEDGNSSTVFSSLHLNTSENCKNNIELNKTISNGYSCIEAVDKESMIPANLSQTSEIMANEIPEKTLERKCPANENKKIGTESHEQNVNMKNDMPTSSSYESGVQISAKVNAVSEMNVLCPLNKKSEARKSPQKRRGTELDLLVQSLGKRRRVSFGGHLSPELFDKRLPPNSPLKKGAIPARLSMAFGNSPRAVLKKAAEVRQSVTQGSFERKQYENIVSRQADLDSVPQKPQRISDPHVARSLSSEGEATSTQERHTESLVSEFKKAASNAASSSRSKTCTRRSSISRKSGTVGTIRSKRRSGASEANLMVVKSWAEVVKQGVPKVQLKSASKQVLKTRKTKKVASKSSKNNNSLKTPKRKISGHFSTGHANSPAPIVIGKAHTGILNVTAQVPTVMNNYPLKKHCDLDESFTGLAEMFCSPSNGKEKSFVPETRISEINASEEFEKNSVLDVNISSRKGAYKSSQDVISPALEEGSQIPIHDNLLASLNERNIMGMEEKNLQQESEPGRQVLEIKRLLKTKKEKSEPLEALSGVKRLLRTPKKKSEPIEALSGVKRLLRTPKEKSDPVEVLSAVKRLSKTPKEKSEPIEALSGVKRLLRTPKEKSESEETLSGVNRISWTPKQMSEPVEELSAVKRLLKTPKEKSEPVEALSAVKRLSNTPKEKSEPDEMLSEVKRLLETPEQKSESDEMLSGVNRISRTPKQKSDPVEALSAVKRLSNTPKEKSQPIEALSEVKRLLETPEQKSESDEMLSGVNRISRTPKQKSDPVEALSAVKRLSNTPKEKSQPIEALSGVKRLLETPEQKSESDEMLSGVNRISRTPKQKSDPVEALSAVKRLSNTPKEKSQPIEALSGVKRLLETPEQKSESDEMLSGVNRISRTPKQKSHPVEALSAVKRLLKTPKEKSEPIEALSAVKRLLRTPKEKSDETLSGVNRISRTPKQKSDPVEALSGVKRLSNTPKEKSNPVEALSAVKRLSNTPKEKSEPDEMLSEVKKLLETPEQKSESDEMLSGVKSLLRTPKEKSESDETLSGVKSLLRTPKEKSESDETLSGVKSLLRTPKEKSESDEMLSGVKRLLRTPKEKSESDETLSGVKSLLRTPKEKSECDETLSGVKSLLRTPKEKSESDETLSGVKSLLRTPKEKSESDEMLSGVKRLLRTPKQKSDPVEALSAVKRLSNTPKEKSEPDEVLSEVKRLLETPEQKSESDETLSGVKRLLRTPKQKSDPVEALSAVKRLLKTPKEKSEPIEALSAVKKLLETPEQKSEPVEVFSAIKTLKTPKQTMPPLSDDIYTKSRLSTEEVSKDMIGSVTKNKTQIMEDTNINDVTEEVEETAKTIEDRGNNQMMPAKERFEPMNNMVGSSQTLKASKSMPTDDYLGLQKFMVEPRESSVFPDIGYTGVKEMLDTGNDKDKMPESLNFVEENGSYTSSRNKLDSMESVPGSCEAKVEMKIEKESHFPVTKSNSSVPNHVDHIACNSFSELKTELNKKTGRTISLSENYEPGGMSFKNEAETDFVKEAAENSDALKPENPEPLASARTRRKKINDCNSAVDTKMIQRRTKNRSTSANCEQIIESFDSHTELNPSHTSESNFTTIEPTKLSKRGRPKKQYVETNGNIGSDNISYTQELEKSLKEVTVEKQPVNRRKVPTKRKGKTVTSMDLEENGPIQENESDLTAKTRLRSRNVKKSASDVKTFAKGKANDTVSEEESNKRNKRRKIAATESTLITTLNADKHGRQKCTISKIGKTEASENNITAVEENLVKKKKKVQFLLRESFKASEEKCALSYESNIQKEEESQTENICNGIPKVPLEIMQTPVEPSPTRIEKLSRKNLRSRGRGKKSVFSPSVESENNRASDGKDHDVIVSLKENQSRRGRRRKVDQVLLKSIPLENNTSGDSAVSKCPSSPGGCSLPQVQKENFEESEMLPLENVQSREGRIPPKKVVKENPPRRGRSKQVNQTSSIKEADVQDPNMAIRQEDNQSKRTRGKRDTQKSCSLKSQRTVKENPPRQGRRKKTISGDVSINSDSTHIIPIIEETMDGKNACLAKEDQSKVGRRTRNTVVFQKILSVKNDTCPNRGEHSDEQPNENLKTANNANENFTYNCRKRKAVHEISANSVSSSKKSECIDDDIQQNGKKNSKTVSKQNTTRNKRKRLTPCGMMNDELRINSKKSPLVTDNVGPLENNFGKRQSKKQKEETNITSLVSPSLKVSITLPPLSSNENQNGNCKVSVGKRELAKLSGTCNIKTRSLRRKDIIPKEELVHETQNKDLQKTAMVTVINQRRGRRKINKLEAAEEKCSLSGGSVNFPDEQILNNVSNKKVSLMGKAPKVLQIKTMTQNINKNDSSNYDQNKNLKHSSMLVQKSSSERAKRKQINNSETSTTANMVKNVIPENKSTVSKTVYTVQTRGKKKMKEENTTLSAELPKETESRTRASKRIRK